MPRAKSSSTASKAKSGAGAAPKRSKKSVKAAPAAAAAASKHAPAAAAVAPVAAAAVVKAPAAVETPKAPESVFTEKFERLSELVQKLSDSFSEGKAFTTEIRKVVSALGRYEKKMQKTRSGRKRRTADGKKVESGITRPVKISDKLCDFLSQDKGTLLARTEVTKRITAYIREHDLQNPDNRTQIQPDDKLKGLFTPLREQDKDKGYTFFNLQYYLKHHYQKAESASA